MPAEQVVAPVQPVPPHWPQTVCWALASGRRNTTAESLENMASVDRESEIKNRREYRQGFRNIKNKEVISAY